MNNDFTVFAVDDDEIVRDMIASMLAPHYPVETFGCAETCRQRLGESLPGVLLLDVALPGMDGYALCRKIKDDEAMRDLPVIFVSALDTLDARLAGFDAGGEDFIVKPFEPEVLLRKVQVAERMRTEHQTLREQVASAEHMSGIALASMGDSGVALQYMSKLVGCTSEQEVAQGFLDVLGYFGLAGAVETRIGTRSHVLSTNGTNQPLEGAILSHLRNMDRIFEFRNRSVYNFDHLTAMVTNMPTEDEELCGRVRDTLAIISQGADSRLQALATAESREQTSRKLMSTLDGLRQALIQFAEAHQRHRLTSSEIMFRVEQNLAKSFVHLGLTEDQERHVENLFRSGMADLMDFVEEGGVTLQSSLGRLSEEIASVGTGG